MRQGLEVRDLISEVQRISKSKVDYIVRSQEMRFLAQRDVAQVAPGGAVIPVDNGRHQADAEWFANRFAGNGKLVRPVPADTIIRVGEANLTANPLANDQLSEYLGVPGSFYDRLRAEHPELLTTTVNTLLQARPKEERRMVRSLDGVARAVLSNSYEPLDNYDLLRFLMPMFGPKDVVTSDGTVIKHLVGPDGQPLKVTFASCDITDRNLYIKIIAPQIRAELAVDVIIQAGALIKNSEVGLGLIAVYPFYEVVKCTNGAYITEYGNTKRHVGKAKTGNGDGNDAERFYSDETKKQRDKAFFMAMADTVRGTLTEAVFNQMLNPIRESMGVPIVDALGTLEVVGKKYDLADKELDGILDYLISTKGVADTKTVWDVSSAITRYSQDVESYERATELEGIGGSIVVLPPTERKTIAEATRSRKYKAGAVSFSAN